MLKAAIAAAAGYRKHCAQRAARCCVAQAAPQGEALGGEPADELLGEAKEARLRAGRRAAGAAGSGAAGRRAALARFGCGPGAAPAFTRRPDSLAGLARSAAWPIPGCCPAPSGRRAARPRVRRWKRSWRTSAAGAAARARAEGATASRRWRWAGCWAWTGPATEDDPPQDALAAPAGKAADLQMVIAWHRAASAPRSWVHVHRRQHPAYFGTRDVQKMNIAWLTFWPGYEETCVPTVPASRCGLMAELSASRRRRSRSCCPGSSRSWGNR